MISIEVVGYDDDELADSARSLAQTLNYTLDKTACPCLYLSAQGLALKMKHFTLLKADFRASTWERRKAEGKKQGLIRACKPTPGLKIIDATAGWGKDAAILASFGAEVLMLERQPVMSALLSDALSRRDELDQQKMHLSLLACDAQSFIQSLQPIDFPDVIYIDPMHPDRNKSALVKKEMQALQQLIGADQDAIHLIECAIAHVKQRVVVKWPQKLPALIKPDACIEGKTVRFDIYWYSQRIR